MEPMKPKDALRTALLNAPQLSRLSGVSLHTVRAILSGKRERIYPLTRQRLAAALRKHSKTLAFAADVLDPPA